MNAVGLRALMGALSLLLAVLWVSGCAAPGSPHASCGGRLPPGALCDPLSPYLQRVQAAFRVNLIWPVAEVDPASWVDVELEVAPDGTIRSRKLLAAEGSAQWAVQVRQAVMRTQRVPLQADGTVPTSRFLLRFLP